MLVQKSKGTRKSFEIVDNGLKYCQRRWFETFEVFLPFEDISNNSVSYSIFPKKSFLAAVFLTLGGTLCQVAASSSDWSANYVGMGLGYYLLALYFWAYFWLHRNSYIRISARGTNLIFLREEPSEEEVQRFIETFRRKKMDYFAKQLSKGYEASSKALSLSEELYKLGKLVEAGILTPVEFRSLKESLSFIHSSAPEQMYKQ